VLASSETATDQDYQGIEGVIGHEYFHNWSGNRVTCRDWFQLSLKEGFTVYRDEEFSADMGSRGVKRIEDVNVLRTHQFREDSGPMAHPIRPESYVEINNFYTVTVYNKGAEVVRMLAHLVGSEGFRKVTDLYFDRFDGQAVTTDDFVAAIEEANDTDFTQFKRWYNQAGTPIVSISQEYEAEKGLFRLKVKQSCSATPGQDKKLPFHIPLAIGLLDEKGNDLPVKLIGRDDVSFAPTTCVLNVCEREKVFEFEDIPCKPVPSLLRDFSAPVKLETDLSDSQYYFLMGNDSDSFNRWEAGQQMAVKLILLQVERYKKGQELVLEQDFINAMGETLTDSELDSALIAAAIALPSEAYVSGFMQVIDPEAVHEAHQFVRYTLANKLKPTLLETYIKNKDVGEYRIDAQSIGRRALKNTCLKYLMVLEDNDAIDLCEQQYQAAHNMTDVIVALACMVNSDGAGKEDALASFYNKWQEDPLVLDKWFSIQATSRLPDTLANVKALTQNTAFSIKNPNKVRALIGAFCNANPVRFHDVSGAGYKFLADNISTLNGLNPQVAARMSNAFSQWRRYDEGLQKKMRNQIERLIW
jgi:aminopeptidase N